MTETRLNVHEAKTHLSRHLSSLRPGDRIILCRRNIPVAEIVPLASPTKEPRPAGRGKGLARLGPGFFDPLPEDFLGYFGGDP